MTQVPTQPPVDAFAEARATATDLLILIGPADPAELTATIGAALEHHEAALQAAERHTDAEWLFHRATGATAVITAMSDHLAATP